MKLSSIAILSTTFFLSLCTESTEVDLVNYIEITATSQILEFDDLFQSYESTFDTDCFRYFSTVGFNYNGFDGENSMKLEIASDNENLQDDRYSIVNGECEYVDISFFHADLLSINEDAYFKEGTVNVSENATVFEFSGRVFKLNANDLEFFIGNAEGLIRID
ncbi:MAG: hypothetical protein H2058_16630 [Muricauda sp.]|nr:hypothetical protein [Allomuricauda sp.]MBA4746871.1 hypothetical protein [Allomuricauda sp.]